MNALAGVPAAGTAERRWWEEGARAEAEIREEGRAAGALHVMQLVDGFGQIDRWQDASEAEFAGLAARIYCRGLPWRERLRLAWVIVRGHGRRRRRG